MGSENQQLGRAKLHVLVGLGVVVVVAIVESQAVVAVVVDGLGIELGFELMPQQRRLRR